MPPPRNFYQTLDRDFDQWDVRQREQQFDDFLPSHRFPFCWACGRGERDKPSDWFAPWLVERAHIIGGNRVKDPRAILLLCSLCHKISHTYQGARFWVDGQRYSILRLELTHRLWLKREFDRAHYDRSYLQSLGIGKLPMPCKPPKDYGKQFEIRRGHVISA